MHTLVNKTFYAHIIYDAQLILLIDQLDYKDFW